MGSLGDDKGVLTYVTNVLPIVLNIIKGIMSNYFLNSQLYLFAHVPVCHLNNLMLSTNQDMFSNQGPEGKKNH